MATRWRDRCPAISERVYRFLVRLYPAAFRREYGDLLVQAFRDSYRDAYRQHGGAGALRLWLAVLSDLVSSALAERISEVLHVSVSSLMGKHLAISAIVGLLWGVLTHFIDDLFYPIPGIGPWLASDARFFVLLVLFHWMALALAAGWYSTRLRGDLWATGATCATLWSSAIVSSILWDLNRYDRLQKLLAGDVSLASGYAIIFVLFGLAGFGFGSLMVYLRGRLLSPVAWGRRM